MNTIENGFGKRILDACCGSRMFHFDKSNPDVLFMDIRDEEHILCDGRELNIHPDVIADFRKMPFNSNTFNCVVFDPPHLTSAGPNGWQGKKYGILDKEWKQDIKSGFNESMRVLKQNGTLIFKWNEEKIKVSEIIKVIGLSPIVGHKSGKQQKTHWLLFMK